MQFLSVAQGIYSTGDLLKYYSNAESQRRRDKKNKREQFFLSLLF